MCCRRPGAAARARRPARRRALGRLCRPGTQGPWSLPCAEEAAQRHINLRAMACLTAHSHLAVRPAHNADRYEHMSTMQHEEQTPASTQAYAAGALATTAPPPASTLQRTGGAAQSCPGSRAPAQATPAGGPAVRAPRCAAAHPAMPAPARPPWPPSSARPAGAPAGYPSLQPAGHH